MSHELIVFGHFPLFATVNRILFLRNNSTHTMSYQWITSDDISEVIIIYCVTLDYAYISL